MSMARIWIGLMLPVALARTFIWTFVRETRAAFWYAVDDVEFDIRQAKAAWRANSVHEEDWK